MERTLRWQLSYRTTGPASQDDKVEKQLLRKLQIQYGDAVSLIKLRTKEG